MRHTIVASFVAFGAVASCARAERAAPARSSEVYAPQATSAPTALPAPAYANPAALAELLAAAPSAHREATGANGTTLVGSDTKVEPPKGRRPLATANGSPDSRAPEGEKLPRVLGRVTVSPPLSSPVLERAAREQLYWPLARACRLPNGELPPADSVTLHFDIRRDGSVLPASVVAFADNDAFRDVAACVERVFAASGFHGPIEGRGASTSVQITWPSVD